MLAAVLVAAGLMVYDVYVVPGVVPTVAAAYAAAVAVETLAAAVG